MKKIIIHSNGLGFEFYCDHIAINGTNALELIKDHHLIGVFNTWEYFYEETEQKKED